MMHRLCRGMLAEFFHEFFIFDKYFFCEFRQIRIFRSTDHFHQFFSCHGKPFPCFRLLFHRHVKDVFLVKYFYKMYTRLTACRTAIRLPPYHVRTPYMRHHSLLKARLPLQLSAGTPSCPSSFFPRHAATGNIKASYHHYPMLCPSCDSVAMNQELAYAANVRPNRRRRIDVM